MRWFITIVTLLIAFTVVKFMPIAIITLGTLVAKRWRTLSAERAIDLNIREAFLKLKDGYEWLPKQGVAFLLLCLTILNLNQTLRAPINLIETPQAAVDFMLQSGLPGPLLNTFGDGGYVSFRYSGNDGVPSELVAIDGRTNLISKDIFAEYEATFFGREGWRSFVARVRPKTILWPTQSPLTALLLNSGEYTRIYRDMNPAGMSVFTMRE